MMYNVYVRDKRKAVKMKKLVLLVMLVIAVMYGMKLNHNIQMRKHFEMMQEQSNTCYEYLQKNEGGICD